MLAEELSLGLQPLQGAFSSTGALRDFLADLGWDFDAPPKAVDSLRGSVADIFNILNGASDLAGTDVARLVTHVRALSQGISQLQTAAELAADFKSEFPRQLVDYLVVDYLLGSQPRLGYLLMALGVITVEDRAAVGLRPAYRFRGFAWEQLSQLARDPLAVFQSAYHWGQGDFKGDRLFESLYGALDAWGLQIRSELLDPNAATNLNKQALQPDLATDAMLRLVLLEHAQDPALLQAGLSLFLLPETTTTKPGLALLPFATAGLEQELALSDELSLAVHADLDLTGGAGILIRPNRDLEFLLGLMSATPAKASGTFALGVRLHSSGAPFTPFGTPAASRFELTGMSTTAGARVSSSGKLDVFAEFALEHGKVVIKPDPASADGFLDAVLPADGIVLESSFTLGASSERGIYFTGSERGTDVNLTLPVNLTLGALNVQSLHLALAASDTKLKAEASASVTAALGPVSVSLDRIGLFAELAFPKSAAPIDATAGFKPPSGVGVSVDAHGMVSGGGFLFHDAARGLYAGALQLSLHEKVTLKAFGLIATRLPDGSRGYSLIVFITAEDFRPIPLGLGFTLLGIGGMVGVNRTFDQDALRQRQRNGTLATLLFPRDPIGNAASLIQDLSTAFPARRGSYLLGLLAKIGWFTPTLIVMDLALILEFGARLRLLALGRISAHLPSADNDLVRINMEALGVIDFDAGTAAIDAQLVDSRLAHKFPITGSAALRAGFGNGPSFVLSVGGLNPHFAPPTNLPSLDRVAIALSSGDNPRLVCEAYFAITSNTVQFGANASLHASAAGFSVDGDVGFDVLVQLVPLHFIADFHARLQLKRGTHNLFMVGVDGSLEGPRPLRVSGKATFSILWCDFSVDFDTTLVHGDPPPLPPAVDVLAQLTDALRSPASWSSQRNAGQLHGVALRSLPPAAAGARLVLDPLGQLFVKQQVVPLNTARDIELFGGAPVAGSRRFSVTAALSGTQLKSTPLQAPFAPAQYFVLSDDEKLVAPSFETMEAGCAFGDATAVTEVAEIISAPLDYRTISITLQGSTPPTVGNATPPPYTLSSEQLQDFTRSGAAARATVRRVGRARFRNDSVTPAATAQPKRWTIVANGDEAAPLTDPSVRTWSEYRATVNALNRGGARFQVVPAHEVEP